MQRNVRTDGQRDMTKPIVTLLNFAIAPRKSARENIQQETVQELNFSELTAQYVTWKIKTFGIRYATEIARVIKSEEIGAGLYDIYVLKFLWFKQAYSSLSSVFYIPRTSLSIKAISIMFLNSLIRQSQTALVTKRTNSVAAILERTILFSVDEQCKRNLVQPLRSI